MAAREKVWHKPNPVPEKWIQSVDENVVKVLPRGSEVRCILRYGESYWTRTARIVTKQADGSVLSFFLKVTQSDHGKAMVSGEFASMKALHDVSPHLCPVPIAWGTFAADQNIHFYLCEFVEMNEDIPDPQELGKALAELHTKTLSPTGKFGFPVPTVQGTIPQYTEWTDSWEEFFTNSIKRVFEAEMKAQGSDDPEILALEEAIIEKVIPRLLRPLETGGREIEPRLIHGDIWDGNTSTNCVSKLPVIFDATCIYAHNERKCTLSPSHMDLLLTSASTVELAPLRPVRHRMRDKYVKAYFNYYEASPPKEDQDDRNALYCLRWDMNCSALYVGDPRWRNICLKVMRYLVAKYPGGYEAWAEEHGELQRSTASISTSQPVGIGRTRRSENLPRI